MPRPIKALNLVAALPTLVTLGNAFCGLLAITYVLEGIQAAGAKDRAGFFEYMELAVLVNLLAMVFDFLDGKVARLTGHASEFGVQVDSLSDVISFGLVPAVMFKALAQEEFGLKPRIALILASFHLFGAVLRLARFNVEADLENDDHRYFKGLPSPAAAAGVGSLVYLYVEATRHYPFLVPYIAKGFPYAIVTLGVLMWTKFPYVHFANMLLTESRHFSHLLLVLVAIAAVFAEPPLAIAVIMLTYALSGPILYVWDLCTGRPSVEGESLM
jgi:CDP-diacylglycerol---serine O-phosphatidyltransferase